jgi:hypothetical protein
LVSLGKAASLIVPAGKELGKIEAVVEPPFN